MSQTLWFVMAWLSCTEDNSLSLYLHACAATSMCSETCVLVAVGERGLAAPVISGVTELVDVRVGCTQVCLHCCCVLLLTTVASLAFMLLVAKKLTEAWGVRCLPFTYLRRWNVVLIRKVHSHCFTRLAIEQFVLSLSHTQCQG